MFGEKNLQPDDLQPSEEGKNIEQREGDINNTAEFETAIENGRIDEAEKFLEDVKNNREEFNQYDDRWVDHQERKLFKAYYTAKDWASAKRIVESSILDSSKEGRKKRLADLSIMKYEDIV